MFNRLRIIAIGAAYAFGLTSFFTYYTADHSNLLLASVLVIMLAHFVVAIGTIRTTLNIASGKRKNSTPSQQNTSPTIRLWKQAIRRAWPWHAALTIPKMGLSLAFVQYLLKNHIPYKGIWIENRYPWTPELLSFQSLVRAYNYVSFDGIDLPAQLYPQWETVLLALFITILFGIANLALLASLVILWQKYTKRMSFLGAIFTRWIIVIPIVVSILLTYPIALNNQRSFAMAYAESCQCSFGNLTIGFKTYWRVIETGYTAGLSFIDEGVLLSANIMRPVGEGSYFAKTNWDDWEQPVSFDNRPFVLRQIVAAALGLGLYGLLTWGALRLAKRGDP